MMRKIVSALCRNELATARELLLLMGGEKRAVCTAYVRRKLAAKQALSPRLLEDMLRDETGMALLSPALLVDAMWHRMRPSSLLTLAEYTDWEGPEADALDLERAVLGVIHCGRNPLLLSLFVPLAQRRRRGGVVVAGSTTGATLLHAFFARDAHPGFSAKAGRTVGMTVHPAEGGWGPAPVQFLEVLLGEFETDPNGRLSHLGGLLGVTPLHTLLAATAQHACIPRTPDAAIVCRCVRLLLNAGADPDRLAQLHRKDLTTALDMARRVVPAVEPKLVAMLFGASEGGRRERLFWFGLARLRSKAPWIRTLPMTVVRLVVRHVLGLP
jgi:AraC-like DNA-binding protein